MSEDFMFLPVAILKQQAVADIVKCNEFTAKYGLKLNEQEISQLVENRKDALESNGRIEFGGGIIPKIIMEFADSPYIYQDNYLSMLQELQECFYYFKNESLDEVTDDELLQRMKRSFDGECQGSVEYLQATVLENFCRDVRYEYEEEPEDMTDTYRDFYEREYEE